MQVGLKHIEPKITYTAKFSCPQVVASNVLMPNIGNSDASPEIYSAKFHHSKIPSTMERLHTYTRASYSAVENNGFTKKKAKKT